MELASARDHIESFVCQLLGTGSMLRGVVSDLSDALPADAYPGEEPMAVVLEMVCGTVRTALGSADAQDIRRATELIDLAGARVIEHLKLASELASRIHADGRSPRRAFG
jgi:hypothetical protein